MVAGASGIDLYLMTVAADDGVMPQTREHAAVLRALAVPTGVVAVTKSDLMDPALAILEAGELLPGVDAVPVSVRTGEGLQELRAALDRAVATVSSRAVAAGPARLHIDRVFTIRGAGTVVTGTLWSGAVGRGDELVLLPSGRRVRVRGVQVHDEPIGRAAAGQRVAVNLIGTAVGEIARGDVLAAADSELRPTYLIDAQLELDDAQDAELRGGRVQVHHGTRESAARIAWLGGRFWQLRLEQPLMPAAGDRLVIRQIAPPDTLGGGVVIDPHPRKHGPSRATLTALGRLARGETPDDEPRQRAAPPAPPAPPPVELSASAQELEQRLLKAGVEPPSDSELNGEDLAALRAAGRAIRVSKTLHFHPDTIASVRDRLIALAGRGDGVITLAQFRDELGTSRRFAQALLEHFDSDRVTIRHGDERRLRRA
jgi:selenocysteine-specific elongation factor